MLYTRYGVRTPRKIPNRAKNGMLGSLTSLHYASDANEPDSGFTCRPKDLILSILGWLDDHRWSIMSSYVLFWIRIVIYRQRILGSSISLLYLIGMIAPNRPPIALIQLGVWCDAGDMFLVRPDREHSCSVCCTFQVTLLPHVACRTRQC